MDVSYYPELDRARFDGLMVCASVWVCPPCAARITEQRRKEIASAISYARSHGLRVVMESFTASHHSRDALRTWLRQFLLSFRHLMSGRASAVYRNRFGCIGSIRAQEVTRGRNGWHPHIHRLVFLPQEVDVWAYSLAVRARWAAATASVDLRINEHGYDWTDTNVSAAEYVAKWGHERGWDESSELAKWHVKRGRSSRTPFDLLRESFTGVGEAAADFREYARAYKGQHQVVWSPGLKQLLSVEEISDQEAATAEGDAVAVLLGWLSPAEWRVILANDARSDVLAAARAVGWPGVCEVLAGLGIPRS